MKASAIARTRPPRRRLRPWHVSTLSAREPGDLHTCLTRSGARHQREGDEPKADETRRGEVGRVDSTCEAREQDGAIRGGARGGKRREGEECGPAKHAPDAESGRRVTGAGTHTRSDHRKRTGEADS